MKKRLLPFIAGMILLTSAGAKAATEIAAIVNDSVVTMTDVRDRTNLYLSGSGHQLPPEERKKMEQQVLAKLIDEALQIQEAKKLSISIDEAQVNNGFGFVAKQNNLSPEDFKKRLKDSGVNIDTLYAQIRAEIAWDQVIRRKLRPQINVSDSDIDMTLDQLAHGEGKKQYHIAEIFVKVADPAKVDDARNKADEAVEKIKKGATFSSVARATSQAPGASEGGDLGWVQEGQLAAELDKALATLQPGQITEPIRAGDGFHILFLREVRQGGAAIAEAAPPAPAAPHGPVVTLKQIVIPVKPTDPVNVIRAKQVRGLGLKKEIKSCAAMDKRMKDFPAQGTGTLGTGAESDLDPALRKVVEKLKVNELSSPIQAPGGWALIMVCERTEGAPQAAAAAPAAPAEKLSFDKTDEKARESVADKIGMQRLNKMADHYLIDLREAAFIDKKL